ncbi:hypothetical protein COO60DRAFT_1643800 [Scenedesmus sp. NREL 46B-D3]|nr:hypothetical protein COO60DRAFT_1643800 [Scenedesmus sp. NREL 46B-D3]
MSGIAIHIRTMVAKLEVSSQQHTALEVQLPPIVEDLEKLTAFIDDARRYVNACYKSIDDAKASDTGAIPFTSRVAVLLTGRPSLGATNHNLRLVAPSYSPHVAVDIGEGAAEDRLNARLAFIKDTEFLVAYASYVGSVRTKRRELQEALARINKTKDKLSTEMTAIDNTIAAHTNSVLRSTANTLASLGHRHIYYRHRHIYYRHRHSHHRHRHNDHRHRHND